jgi:uncharacterized protein YcbX
MIIDSIACVRVSAVYTYPIKGCFRTEHREAQVQPWGLRGDRRFVVADDADSMLTQREEPRLVHVKPELDGDRLVLRSPGMADLAVTVRAGEPVDVKVFVDPVRVCRVDPAADEWLSTVLGRPARLLWLDDPTRRPVKPAFSRPADRVSLADATPLLLANARSLDVFNDWLLEADSPEWPLPMSRFRPNIVVDGTPAWAEDGWTGRRMRIGDVWFRAPRQAPRCVVTTTDQDTGDRDREPLRTLGRYRNIDQALLFGLGLIPDRGAAAGDVVGRIAVGDEVLVDLPY